MTECTGAIAHNVSYVKPCETTLFNRKYKPLNETDFPIYHNTLKQLNQDKISFDVARCGIDAIKMECKENPAFHKWFVPILCQRRTCPECCRIDMYDKYQQYHEISEIAEKANGRPGEYYPSSWRVRFFTLTSFALPDHDLEKPIDACKKALKRFWRYTFGERGMNEKKAGGLFMLEVQSGWNVHFHGLVLSPFIHESEVKEVWSESLEKNGWYGKYANIQVVYPGKTGSYNDAVLELLQYPVKPNKRGRHDQKLMAYVEAALYKKKRIISKGAWYNQFPKEYNPTLCPICDSDITCNFRTDRDLIKIFGETYKRNFFDYTEEGEENFEKYTKKGLIESYRNGNVDHITKQQLNRSEVNHGNNDDSTSVQN